MRRSPSFFLAGIIQGSLADSIHGQEYRGAVKRAILERFPDADIFDPIADHPNSLSYSDRKGREVFMGLLEESRRRDCLIAFLPEASMGTAVEIWNAREAGKAVIAISPLEKNWVVRYLVDCVCEGLDEFARLVESGGIERLLEVKSCGAARS